MAHLGVSTIGWVEGPAFHKSLFEISGHHLKLNLARPHIGELLLEEPRDMRTGGLTGLAKLDCAQNLAQA